MRLHFVFAYTLSVTLAITALSAVPAAHGQEAGSGQQAVVQAVHDGAQAEECEACGFSSCGCDGNVDLGLQTSILSRGQFYAGGEYLSVRSTFSESTAFIATTTDPVTGDETSVFGELGFDYEGSYRVFAGYRLPECGGEFEFGFTNLSSGGTTTSPLNEAPSATDPFTTISAPLLEIPLAPGQSLQTVADVDAQVFDFSFSRSIPLGSPACCGGCGDACGSECGDCCGCGWCPAWDITWSGGLRYADVDWSTQTTVAANPLTTDPTVNTALDFNGFGARFGLEGRRYLGRSQAFSLFIKGDISLLLGQIDLFLQQDEVAPTPDATVFFSSTQIVPVTDIVLGATAQVTHNTTITAGYLLSAWHDLGMRGTTTTDIATASIPDLTFDDANILGFDGFFLRGEFAF